MNHYHVENDWYDIEYEYDVEMIDAVFLETIDERTFLKAWNALC